MKSKNIIEEFQEYRDRTGNRKELYRAVAKRYDLRSALYPGSHIDIAPSLVIPKVIYVDNFKGAISFFKSMEVLKEYINENKEYEEPCDIVFKGQDYTRELNIEPVDLIISQYAGFVGQATKKYLRTGGILLCNDSHGDATLSRFDNDFEFVGVIGKNNRITDSNLVEYFVMPKNKDVELAEVKEKMKGPKYKLTAENYLFRKK
ncbi:hypothetical protein [Acidaminobacter hydrogenoformans]|uniref:Uncharacterized protein n=1 Tax=Acidaminobacter hydrogenoformans DSM 2784 TaxID=1120920 RepID=A0A1G5S0B8_9FIRM|nr:hypothetical protein [Acidaminobacter hydrogenoformans]SCZ79845.1 hypothetical protein SAMN03080599_01970 [Acidaminobacter hydrogenoformans DSM 2784]